MKFNLLKLVKNVVFSSAPDIFSLVKRGKDFFILPYSGANSSIFSHVVAP